MMSKTYYYARAFNSTQNIALQTDIFKMMGAKDSEIFIDGPTDSESNCPNYVMMQEQMQSGDILVLKSLSAIGRQDRRIKNELEYYKEQNIRVCILEIPTTCFEPKPGQEWALDLVRDTIIQMVKTREERQHCIYKDRHAQKIAAGKIKSKNSHGQRPFVIDKNELQDLYDQYMRREIKKAEIARKYGISRVTLDKIFIREGIAKNNKD